MQFEIDHFLAGLTLGRLLNSSTKLMTNTCEVHRMLIRVRSQPASLELIYNMVTVGHELRQALGDGERLGSLACYNLWGLKELDTTWRLRPTS